jgi:8-amino-7-oxononanoate synthase
MTKLEDYAKTKQRELAKADRARELKETTRTGTTVTQNGKTYISFSDNDYLGLSQHPEVVAAAKEALEQYGAGAGASRLVTGNHPLYAKLETKLAKMKGTEAALVFGSGYLANVGIIPALMTTKDIIFADKLVHACLLDGALLTGAAFKRFRHNDPKHLEELLVEHRGDYENALILADHVYSMDGDVAPLGHLARLARDYEAWTLIDDAHGLGMVKSDPKDKIDLWMGTLSKSVGSYGGYVAAKKPIIDLLVSRARSLIFSTGLPPSACAAAFAALEIIEEEPKRGARAIALADKVCDALKMQRTGSAIVPIVLGEESNALEASEALKKRGILAVAIRPPAVPVGFSRLRLTFSSEHTDEQVKQLITALEEEKIKPHA